MNYKKEMGKLQSRNGLQDITYYVYMPLTTPKAVVQIAHGMAEYLERYEPLIDYLTGQGFLVCGNDHIGHKNSSPTKDSLGYFAPKNGYTFLARDLARVTRLLQKHYPDLPYFLFGHSMGSFVARAYLTRYSDLIDGVILCGTAGSNPALPVGSLLISLVKLFKGEFHRSPFIDKLMFGSYNSHYKEVKTNFDWLTRDQSVVQKYIEDEYCGFLFTTSAYKDLTRLLKYVNSKGWYSSVPKNMPMLLIAGEMDPVGNWGKGVREVSDKLHKHGVTNLTTKLYPDMRHEIHNEIGKEEVYGDLNNWLNKQLTLIPPKES